MREMSTGGPAMSSFQSDKQAGEKAEKFFEQYGKSLLFPPDDPRIPLMLKRFEPEQGYFTDWPVTVTPEAPLDYGPLRRTDEEIHVEGADLEAWIMNPLQPDKIKHGWIEVKSVRNNGMILFGRFGYPAVPFEITSQRGGTQPGWLYDLLHPKESCERRKLRPDQLRAISPAALVFCQYEGAIGTTPPYAVISFYEFSQLKQALIEIAHERYGIDLMEWKFDPDDSGKKATWNKEYHSPYWDVSLQWLQAKRVPMAIYLFGKEPDIPKDQYYRYNYEKWQTLKEMAAAHYSLEDLKKDHEGIKTPDQEPEWTEQQG